MNLHRFIKCHEVLTMSEEKRPYLKQLLADFPPGSLLPTRRPATALLPSVSVGWRFLTYIDRAPGWTARREFQCRWADNLPTPSRQIEFYQLRRLMKRIDLSKLRKGDILLTTSSAKDSQVIQAVTGSDISHAMLYVADGSVMDSTGEGVHARNLQRMIYDDDCAVYAYRAKARIDPETMDTIVDYVRSETGAPYAHLEAMRSPFTRQTKGGAAQFCSRLVARAYANAGFPLTDNADFSTPADLQRSDCLERIPDVVLHVSAEQKAELEEGDSVNGMRKVTNDLLTRVRAISPAIRVLSDVEPFLLGHPEFDAAISEAYRASGFLDYWQVEVQRHPYRYDPVEMVRFYQATAQKAELLQVCRETLKQEASNDFRHWQVNLDTYAALLEIKPLETFRLNHALYVFLCFNQERRLKTARMLLSAYGDRASK